MANTITNPIPNSHSNVNPSVDDEILRELADAGNEAALARLLKSPLDGDRD
ncbi:hypothetical protein [Streptomyces sp. NBC_01353]|uniref:hypothetical protein n=1 Tax=Streptomyces sp. NBC_01353 TaxID=2903835 RepID=UPI002E337137|nr:hypothetical protein [Streptomyces sp. NBC_01353]